MYVVSNKQALMTFFLILHYELWDLKLAVIALALITRQKWNGGWKKVIFRPNMRLYFRF